MHMAGLLRVGRTVIFAFSLGFLLAAQTPSDADFLSRIQTPAALQETLEHCDGHPDFETALANWLERAQPSSPVAREAIRTASLRLLEDTTDRQLVLGLSDGLLRHALEDVKQNAVLVPEDLARALYADIGKAIRSARYKAKIIVVPAHGLAEDGTVRDARQARFLEIFLNLAEPQISHLVSPYPQREQADKARALPQGR